MTVKTGIRVLAQLYKVGKRDGLLWLWIVLSMLGIGTFIVLAGFVNKFPDWPVTGLVLSAYFFGASISRLFTLDEMEDKGIGHK